jgi:peptide/nickel transport system substrate-binding protein
MGLASAPSSLDPRLATDASSERINRLLYDRLVDLDDAGMPVPGIARWERLRSDHYRFFLNPQRRGFHDGSRLGSGDVKATIEFVLDPENGSPHRTTLSIIDRIETPSGEQIDFFLRRPDPLFPAYLGVGIVPKEEAARSYPFNSRPLGSGPFRFVAWPTEGRLILQRLRDAQHFSFLQVKDPNVRIMKLLRGEIDMLQNDLPPELAAFLARQPGVVVTRAPGTNFSYIGFNLKNRDTGRLRVRLAVAHAIDRNAIIEYLMQGGARPAQALLPPEHWAGGRGLSPVEFDPPKARELLREAGYGSGHPLELEYKTSSDPFRVRIATIIQSQLARVGIRVKVRSYDWGTFFGDIKTGRFQLYSLTWVGVRTPDLFRYIFHSSSLPPGGANRGRYHSAEVDRLIEAAEAAGDISLQAPIYRKLQALLLVDLPYLPLWYEDQLFVIAIFAPLEITTRIPLGRKFALRINILHSVSTITCRI